MEALGVATGAIFGEYKYGPTMWFQWLGVPFVIALNWCVLTLACNEVAVQIMERLFPAMTAASPITPASPPTKANRISNIANRQSHISPPPTTDYPLPTTHYPLPPANRISNIPYRISHILPPTLAAILTALYDVTIEPVAIALDYWQWGGGEIPLQNYLAWAAIAFLISLPLYVFKIRFRSQVLLVYFFSQLFFFLVLNMFL